MVPIDSACIHRYIPHLRESISLGGRDVDWVNAARHPELLMYDGLETLGRKFKGTTDVVLANRSAIRTLQPERGLRLLFKLKKAVEKADVIQVQASMLLANVHSPELRPMMVSPDPSVSQCKSVAPDMFAGMYNAGNLAASWSLIKQSKMQPYNDAACVGSDSAFLSNCLSVSLRTAMMTHTRPRCVFCPQYMIAYANLTPPSSDGLI